MVPSEFLQIAEGLSHLDPIRTYPDRAAKLVANLVNASAYWVEYQQGEAQQKIYSIPPPPTSGSTVSLPLRYGRSDLGQIHLCLPEGNDKFDELEMRLARWGARVFARGLTYTNRMSWPSPSAKKAPIEKRVVRGIQNRLERSPLTPREKQVVSMLVAGSSTRSIAAQARLTVATVHTYLKRIYSKLGIHSRIELVTRMTGTEGVTSLPPPISDVYDDTLDIQVELEEPSEQQN